MKIEVTAKKVQDAINMGLAQLGATLDEVDVKVIDQGGLFRKAKIEMTIDREENAEKAPAVEPAKPQPAAQKPQAQAVEKPQSGDKPTEKQPQPQKQPEKAPARKPESKPADKKPQQQKPQAKPTEKKPVPENAENNAPRDAAIDSGRKPRKLSASDKEAAAHALEFVRGIVQKMGFDATAEADPDNCEYIDITAASGDDNLIIGRRGETLAAIAYLAETCARAEKAHIGMTVDCNGYRDRRAEKLVAEARRRADECVRRNRKIRLEPMDRVDRRTVHNALSSDPRVSTASEGKEPHRYVVIIPGKVE